MNPDCTVECLKCGKQQRVNFLISLRSGWPRCCGRTMRLITKAKDIDIDGAVGAIVSEAVPQVNGERRTE